MIEKNILILGGDTRQLEMMKIFVEEGYIVGTFGFEKTDESLKMPMVKSFDDLFGAMEWAKVVILPLPTTFDGNVLNTPKCNEKIMIAHIMNLLDSEHMIFGAMLSEEFIKAASEKCKYVVDYFAREELAINNAIPTSEGAIEIAMGEMPITLHGSSALIMGYGRIGKVLARMLMGIGANVTVAVRKHGDIAWIKENGARAIFIKDIKEKMSEFDVIFNTIPKIVLDEEILMEVREDGLIIDLASKPGGVDFEKARFLGKKTIWALSLPGRVAPRTAGAIIKDTIVNVYNELI